MQVEGCRLRDVTFILGDMRERRRRRRTGEGSSGGWVAGRGLGTTV